MKSRVKKVIYRALAIMLALFVCLYLLRQRKEAETSSYSAVENQKTGWTAE